MLKSPLNIYKNYDNGHWTGLLVFWSTCLYIVIHDAYQQFRANIDFKKAFSV